MSLLFLFVVDHAVNSHLGNFFIPLQFHGQFSGTVVAPPLRLVAPSKCQFVSLQLTFFSPITYDDFVVCGIELTEC